MHLKVVLVAGLAETLVRNAPGQALVFTVVKDKDMDEVRPIVGSYLNKATPLQGGDFIFRRTVTRKSWMGSVGRGYTNMFRKAIRGRAVDELRRLRKFSMRAVAMVITS